MRRTLSLVEARRELGRLAEEVRRTGQPIVLTKRGRAVACIVPEPAATRPARRAAADAFAALRGTVRMNCTFAALDRAVRALRSEFAESLERRAASSPRRGVRARA